MNALRRKLWNLAVEVRRTVPKDLTNAEAQALIAEFEKLPRHPVQLDSGARPRRDRERMERGRKPAPKHSGYRKAKVAA